MLNRPFKEVLYFCFLSLTGQAHWERERERENIVKSQEELVGQNNNSSFIGMDEQREQVRTDERERQKIEYKKESQFNKR